MSVKIAFRGVHERGGCLLPHTCQPQAMPRPGFGGVSGVFSRLQATISSTCSKHLNNSRAPRLVATAMLKGRKTLPSTKDSFERSMVQLKLCRICKG